MTEDDNIKHKNFCAQANSCNICENYANCKAWTEYVDKHGHTKRYAHFDHRTSLQNDRTRQKVMSPEWVEHHAFWPFIYFVQHRTKFSSASGKDTSKKPRSINYSSHIDRCIYQRYGFLVNQKYNEYAAENKIDKYVIAYRTNCRRNNLDYAKAAFDFIDKCERCFVLVSDFSDFFDNIDHRLLKRMLCAVMGTKNLPNDYYAVFKSITRYSSWPWENLLEIRGLLHDRAARKHMNNCETIISGADFRKHATKAVEPHRDSKGIPQGSAMSAILSNIYMIEFDKKLSATIASLDGLYYRYCDDLLIILPFSEDNENATQEQIVRIKNRLLDSKYAKINESKTELLRFDTTAKNNKAAGFNNETNKFDKASQLSYLGLTYDGINRLLRKRAVGKHYRRMQRKVGNVYGKKSYKNAYRIYASKHNAADKEYTFVDYARKAREIVGLNDSDIDKLVKHDKEIIAKTKNRLRRKDGQKRF